ncbi:type 2 isopentenyl-diphosphate Delta-isomerase [Vagococcus salmoninarum]|uniref:type 2 isopentenyl-diphosphate Delta-isomerase n=1 Tax=Vagococcus salmoninarum TaxID=2739 RepID=UPI001880401C|nr:type 2 isopentenyl-diphosphate Delta-isomerase [Vagococcus salmoninarum]MBE9390378.1 type 2 isopentenyl-diphosphate Delta-isomerase [Vagococcus salmoninarum]
MSIHQHRKDQHVEIAEKLYHTHPVTDFEAMRFVHHSFPQMNRSDVSLKTNFASFDLPVPFYINGMTGGSDKTKKINRDLALVARETGLAMASGSVSAGLKHPETASSFTIIRETNPNGKIFANLGAEHSVENGKRAVELLQADALQIHVNAPQELVMPDGEGERNFSHWLTQIQHMVEGVGVPVIVKEVGFGMSRETIQQLAAIGVKTIDISGRGGTNFVSIENARRSQQEFSFAANWGQSTAISLIEAASTNLKVEILASGGIKTPMDMLKSLALGAKATGLSGHFLHLIQNEGVEKTILEVEAWKETLQTMMTLLGASTIADLTKTDLILTEPINSWCDARQIDWHYYANRR